MYTLLLNVAPAIQTRPGSLADTVLQLLAVRPSSISVVVAKFQLPLMPPVTKRTYIHIDIEYTAKNVKGNILATPHDDMMYLIHTSCWLLLVNEEQP